MDYKLAKQLKDAGFKGQLILSDGNGEEMYSSPSLSELIEECGDGTIHLWNKEYVKNSWKAQKTLDDKIWQVDEFSATPKIAVVKLWLALNKK